jgi:hypothetical protein
VPWGFFADTAMKIFAKKLVIEFRVLVFWSRFPEFEIKSYPQKESNASKQIDFPEHNNFHSAISPGVIRNDNSPRFLHQDLLQPSRGSERYLSGRQKFISHHHKHS